MKTCTVCGRAKPSEEFYLKTWDRLRADCKECHKKNVKQLRHKREKLGLKKGSKS